LSNQPVPEIIDPVFAKTSQNARFLSSENEHFGLVFVKTGSINSGTGVHIITPLQKFFRYAQHLPSLLSAYRFFVIVKVKNFKNALQAQWGYS
jgi:hypothetical protein